MDNSTLSRVKATFIALLQLVSASTTYAARVYESPLNGRDTPTGNYFKDQRIKELRDHLSVYRTHFESIWRYTFQNINPQTYVAYSFPEERRLPYWGVSYDNAIRIMAHVRAGQIEIAKKSMEFFMTQLSAQRDGWIM